MSHGLTQSQYRMPITGQLWRHYKGGLYVVVGIAQDERCVPVVVYTEYNWKQADLPPLYTQPLERFLGQIETTPSTGAKSVFRQRFLFERDNGPDNCAFIASRE